MKIRIKFRKYGCMKFIGHLDIMRYFQKCMRRADIDIVYSEGYSPHQVMSLAAPLGVGITSDGEYLDIEVNTALTSREALQALNEVMVEGIEVTQYRILPEHAPNAMSLVAAADYTVFVKEGQESFCFQELKQALESYLQKQDQILITKKTKKSERVMDLKPLIHELKAVLLSPEQSCAEEFENGIMDSMPGGTQTCQVPAIFMKLSAGSTDNIKPELVLDSFFNYCRTNIPGIVMSPTALQVHRNEIYMKKEDGHTFLPLGDLGQDMN